MISKRIVKNVFFFNILLFGLQFTPQLTGHVFIEDTYDTDFQQHYYILLYKFEIILNILLGVLM